jgi:2-polyprenyl-6-methoxyphenol hydroxylase-like FAD-dependent oxidoreductase
MDSASDPNPASQSEHTAPVLDSTQTTCCIVGGGPGGMMLALLLARKGVSVTLLEAHKDFDRDFRGDTIHPSILEILDEIGLAEPLHRTPAREGVRTHFTRRERKLQPV